MLFALAAAAAAEAAGVRLVHEDAHLAVVWKPSGVSLSRAQSGGKPERAGAPVEAWAAAGGVRASAEPDAQAPRAASVLERAVGGLVPLSKTARAAAALRDGASATRCDYAAVVASPPGARLPPHVQLLQAAQPPGRLALVRVLADGAQRPLAEVSAALRACGAPVLGVPAQATAASPPRDGVGGAHIALVGLALPPALAALRGADAPAAFAADVPRKFAKAMQREALHAARLRELAAPGSPGAGVQAEFCGIKLQCASDQLRPRPSSAPLVAAAVAAAARHAQPRLLDLGCGGGALLLAALAALPEAATGAGVDLDAPALALARTNAAAVLGADAAAARVALLRADFGALHAPATRAALHPGGYHAVVCNPPYLRQAAAAGRVTAEPARVLVAGDDGLRAYDALARSLAAAAPPLLAHGGVLALQLPGGAGPRGIARIAAVFTARGFRLDGTARDARGVERALLMSQPSGAGCAADAPRTP
jgi:release factor glutamine methyltransferase